RQRRLRASQTVARVEAACHGDDGQIPERVVLLRAPFVQRGERRHLAFHHRLMCSLRPPMSTSRPGASAAPRTIAANRIAYVIAVLLYFTTVSVTSTFTISPLTLSVAVVNCAVPPSFRTIESVARNDRKVGLPLVALFDGFS